MHVFLEVHFKHPDMKSEHEGHGSYKFSNLNPQRMPARSLTKNPLISPQTVSYICSVVPP